MPYPAADVEILDVEFETPDKSPITQGSNVAVEVDIRNNKNELALGIVGVESPSSNNTILQTCILLAANSTDSIDDSTADGTLDGEFSVLETPKEVTVTVGGYNEEDFVGSCAGMTPADFETESKTFEIGISDAATITNVVANANDTTATITADVVNNASVGLDVTVNVTESDNQLAQEVVGVGANSTKTVQFDIDFNVPNNQQATKTICVEEGDVQIQ